MEKLKNGIEEMSRKNFSIEYLQQIMTVFPAAYTYSWENTVGRYGNVLSDFELHISVNTNYKNDTSKQMGGKVHTEEKIVSSHQKLGPAEAVERKAMFANSLQMIVIQHHSTFCENLSPPVKFEVDKMVDFHRDFALDFLPPIPLAELPEKPRVEICSTAKQVLESSRSMFENNPKRLEEFRKIASKKKAAHVRKELLGLPKELQKKIRAKEVEKMALDMFADKVFY